MRSLLFVHGRAIHRRLAVLVCYIFYKNMVQTLAQFWFTGATGWSGQTPFLQMVINCASSGSNAGPSLTALPAHLAA